MHRLASFALLATTVVLFLLSSSADARVTRQKRQATIGPDCYTPTGGNCTWYRYCLEASIPCQGTPDDYAIAYAEKYCNLFNSNYNKFSSEGKQWVDAVRKCLQVKLVPLLIAGSPCNEIKSTAFDSHVTCYLSPGGGAPGLCDLLLADIRIIRDIVLGAMGSAFWESLRAGLKVAVSGGCLFKLVRALL